MAKYSKLIGTLIGGLISMGVAIGFLSPELLEQSPAIINAVAVLGAALGTFFAPANDA